MMVTDVLPEARKQLLEAIEQAYDLGVLRIEQEVERTTSGLLKIGIEGKHSVWLRIGNLANRTAQACASGALSQQ